MRPPTATLVFTLLSIISSVSAQTTTATAAAGAASPDGVIVPFNSGLPACASLCGPLFDVQGKCSPPATTAVDENCFCTDSRLTVFDNDGTTGVALVCGAQSCNTQSDMEAVKKWYDDFCAKGKVVTTTASDGAIATQTGASKPKATGASTPSWYVPLQLNIYAQKSQTNFQSQDLHTLQMGNHDRRNLLRHSRRLDRSLSPPPQISPQEGARNRDEAARCMGTSPDARSDWWIQLW